MRDVGDAKRAEGLGDCAGVCFKETRLGSLHQGAVHEYAPKTDTGCTGQLSYIWTSKDAGKERLV